MRMLVLFLLGSLFSPLLVACGGAESSQEAPSVIQSIIEMERVALERWCKGDPDGFLEIIADDYTYFDPTLDERLDGRAAILEIYENVRGEVSFPRFELIDPRVQVAGDIGVLTFNLKTFGPDETGVEVQSSHWHSTEVFRRLGGEWKLISTHRSYTPPALMSMAEEGELTGETTVFTSVNMGQPSGQIPNLVVKMERAALERWGSGDPSGFLDMIAPAYTYFDPSRDKRIDGLQAITDHYDPIRGQVRSSRYEMIEPYVQTDGTTAVLTFNLKSYGEDRNANETLRAHWHSTEIYRQIDAEWKLISTHWSYTASWLHVLSGRLPR